MAVEVTTEMVEEARRLSGKAGNRLYHLEGDVLTGDAHQIDINNARANAWYAHGIADALAWVMGDKVGFPSFLTTYKTPQHD